MKVSYNWTPLGSGASAIGHADQVQDHLPGFPDDLVCRAENLDLGIESLFFAWEIARLPGENLSVKEQRALMLLVLATIATSAGGSTRLPLTDLYHLDSALNELALSAEERLSIDKLLEEARKICRKSSESPLSSVFGGPHDYQPLIINHDCLYIQKLHVLETRVGENLRQRIKDDPGFETIPGGGKLDPAVEKALDEVIASPPVESFRKVELDDQQQEAVRAALSGRITIISGRPGSGKTSIVANLLRVLARAGKPALESIALAAPTGKAADRLRQSITNHLAAIPVSDHADRRLADRCPTSSTLHRLLGYSPGADRFLHNEHNLLSEQFVIVDESSMIDLAMMDNLLRALSPRAHVVFLGDADQLPSIEAGAVMRDLCQGKTANQQGRVVVLNKSYRAREEDSAGRKILDVANAVNEGASPKTAGGGKALAIRNQVSELNFTGIEHLQPGDDNQKFVFLAAWQKRLRSALPDLKERLSREYAAGPSGFDEQTAQDLRIILSHYERFRILCVTRIAAGGTGSEPVNAWFHRRWLDEFKRSDQGIPENRSFLAGEPLLITRNDYAHRLYNGDSGLVLRVATSDGTRRHPAKLMAVFPRGNSFAAFPLEALRGKLDLAWATTVHKAQGSEYDNVAIMLPEGDVRPLTRELLYTAITRAKTSVILVGPSAVLEIAVKRTMRRASGLADALSNPGDSPE